MEPPPSADWRPASAPPAWTAAAGHLWRVDLRGDAQPLETWRSYLSCDEAARADRFTSPRERRRFIVARGALRAILAAYLRVAPAALRFEYGPAGKPRLAGPPTAPRFNLSHCEDAALVAVSAEVDVGVDLERVRFRPAALDIAERYWTREELAACRHLWSRVQQTAAAVSRPTAAADAPSYPLASAVVPSTPPLAAAPPSAAAGVRWETTSSVQLASSLVRRPEVSPSPLAGGGGACQAARDMVQAFSSGSLSVPVDHVSGGAAAERFPAAEGVTSSASEGVAAADFDVFWTRIWARKEALLKGLGGGMFLPMERIAVWPPEGEPTWRSEDGEVRRLPWMLQEFQPSPLDCACVAWEGTACKWIQLEFSPGVGVF